MGYFYLTPDQSYDSVPHRYVGQRVDIHYRDRTIEVYDHRDHMAWHQRQETQGESISIRSHRAKKHRHDSRWTPANFIEQAQKYGPHVVTFVGSVLRSWSVPKMAYKRMKSLFRLADQYGHKKWNQACNMAFEEPTTSCPRVGEILDKNTDQQLDQESEVSVIPIHQNIRGPQAFQSASCHTIGYH